MTETLQIVFLTIVCIAWLVIIFQSAREFANWRMARQAKSDERAIRYRMREILATVQDRPVAEWPHQLPEELAKHRHQWVTTSDIHTECICGAIKRPDGNVMTWTRGQVVVINDRLCPILFQNVGGCKHYVVQTGDNVMEAEHFSASDLAELTEKGMKL